MFKNFKKVKRNGGQAMILSVIFFLFISLATVSGLVSPSLRNFKIASDLILSEKSYALSESGIENTFYRLKNSVNVSGAAEPITIDGSTSITDISDDPTHGQKVLTATGDVSSRERINEVKITTDVGVSFSYGVQVGQGGIDLQGSSGITGNVYANGPITGSSSSYITGTAISANSPSVVADQTNGSGIPPYNVSFGNTNGTQDIAQSFKITTPDAPLSKVRFYIKKVGSPSNATVKIMSDSNGTIGTSIIASGTLTSSTITTSYGWIDVTFSTSPILDVGTTYWLLIDASTSSSKYYIIGASSSTYANGVGEIGQSGGTWNNTTPSGLDYYFNIYLGGYTGLIAGSSGNQNNQISIGTVGSGSAQAHTVNYTKATGLIYCQTGTGNNKSCTAKSDPAFIAMPVSDGNIDQWKTTAEAGGVINGNYDVSGSNAVTLGPKKITGNLTVGGSGILSLSGTVWVQGNVIVSGSGKIVLASSYGHSSGLLVADGYLNLGGSGQLNGTGQSGSYILFVTTSSCDKSFCAQNAIDISGNAGSVILNAQNGTIGFTGSASAKEATANKMSLSGNTNVTYDSGLANINFTSGPSGSWSINSWKETE